MRILGIEFGSGRPPIEAEYIRRVSSEYNVTCLADMDRLYGSRGFNWMSQKEVVIIASMSLLTAYSFGVWESYQFNPFEAIERFNQKDTSGELSLAPLISERMHAVILWWNGGKKEGYSRPI